MAYTAKDATNTLFRYMGLNIQQVSFIEHTSNRGVIFTHPSGEKCVIFIYPISHKADDTKNFFDTRDSGAYERGVAWNYALQNNLKYFCLAVHDQVPRYKDYIFSLECNEKIIEEVSGTVGGSRAGSGTQVVIPNDYNPHKEFDRILTKNGFFISVIHKDHILDYIHKYDNRPYLLDNKLIDLSQLDKNIDENRESGRRVEGGQNILLYGVPGCGKSYTIQTKYCKEVDGIERVVFHPDYTYGDFVGQIIPTTTPDNTIEYVFSPGPFTRILYEAYNNRDKKYCLVIEELNRGNAPSIFGDIFQLLDRDENGNSSYSISNTDIANIVFNGDKNKKVFIPSNLSILATMNTSDQNVFTLDTAFQRRWKMRMIENDVDKATTIANMRILDTSITWSKFNKVINLQILMKNVGMSSSEDKRLGAYFVSPQDLKYHDPNVDGLSPEQIEEANDHNRNFPEKVLKYLWDDAFKFNRHEVFKEEYTSLEQLISAFESATGDARFNIFIDDIFNFES